MSTMTWGRFGSYRHEVGLHGCSKGRFGSTVEYIVCRMRIQSMQLDCRRLSLFIKRILVHAAEF